MGHGPVFTASFCFRFHHFRCRCALFFLVYTVLPPERFPESISGFASSSFLIPTFSLVEIYIYGTGFGIQDRYRGIKRGFMVFLLEKGSPGYC